MQNIVKFRETDWLRADRPSADTADVRASLESGAVVHLPELAFPIAEAERLIFTPGVLASAKNVSFDPVRGRLSGTALDGEAAATLQGVMARFGRQAETLVSSLTGYGGLVLARASFRPAEIAGRVTSWRKDDTRLHVDSFPASPVRDHRILRLFTNVNPEGRPRAWRVGDDFERVARRFGPKMKRPFPLSAPLLRVARLTKTLRSEYDALMLQLHDLMKADEDFQAHSPQTRCEFPSGSTWLAFTDEVPHAAMAGQYQFEQTFLLPVDAMSDPSRSPLRILERLFGRALT